MRTAEPEDWTDEIIRRFWAFPRDEALYFSRMVGRGLARFLELSGYGHGRALDFGCGPGYLLNHMLAGFDECYGVDFSLEAVAAAERRLAGDKGWRGARFLLQLPTDFPDAFFDLITCVETIEHLREEQLGATLGELRRLVRPGGAILFTTPNGENLAEGYTYCPFCDTRFHQWQHFRSFSAESLRETLERHGFAVTFCRGIDLGRFETAGRPGGPLLADLRWRFRWTLMARLDQLSSRPHLASRRWRHLLAHGPHLCALATRQQ